MATENPIVTASDEVLEEVQTSAQDAIRVQETGSPKAAAASSYVSATDSAVLAANANRKGWIIQNLDDVAVYVKLGAGASNTDFSFVLKAGDAANDGKGGSFTDELYTGIVSVKASSGWPRVVTTELT